MDDITDRHDAPLCPSARPDMEGAGIFGVVGGTTQEPRVVHLVQPLPADERATLDQILRQVAGEAAGADEDAADVSGYFFADTFRELRSQMLWLWDYDGSHIPTYTLPSRPKP